MLEVVWLFCSFEDATAINLAYNHKTCVRDKPPWRPPRNLQRANSWREQNTNEWFVSFQTLTHLNVESMVCCLRYWCLLLPQFSDFSRIDSVPFPYKVGPKNSFNRPITPLISGWNNPKLPTKKGHLSDPHSSNCPSCGFELPRPASCWNICKAQKTPRNPWVSCGKLEKFTRLKILLNFIFQPSIFRGNVRFQGVSWEGVTEKA